jgi:hypothetical protein
MLPKYHLFYGILFAGIVFLLFPEISIIGFAVIILSTVFIDIDHYIYYIILKKDYNLKRSYLWYSDNIKRILSLPINKRKKYYHGIYFLHGIEVMIILVLFGILIHPIFIMILTGFNFHLFLDIASDYKNHTNSYKLSIIQNRINKKDLKILDDTPKKQKKGIDTGSGLQRGKDNSQAA